jgi:hypothetical protein
MAAFVVIYSTPALSSTSINKSVLATQSRQTKRKVRMVPALAVGSRGVYFAQWSMSLSFFQYLFFSTSVTLCVCEPAE